LSRFLTSFSLPSRVLRGFLLSGVEVGILSTIPHTGPGPRSVFFFCEWILHAWPAVNHPSWRIYFFSGRCRLHCSFRDTFSIRRFSFFPRDLLFDQRPRPRVTTFLFPKVPNFHSRAKDRESFCAPNTVLIRFRPRTSDSDLDAFPLANLFSPFFLMICTSLCSS